MFQRKLIKSDARKQIKRNGGFIIASIVLAEILANLGLIEQLIYISGIELPYIVSNSMQIMGFLLSGVMIFGVCRISLGAVKGEEKRFRDLFSGLEIYLKVLGLYIIITTMTVLGNFLFVVPGVIVSLMFSQAFYILSENDDKSIVTCLKESAVMMRGHKLEFFYLQLSFAGWFVISVLTLGLGLLWMEPYVKMTMANYYLKLKEESDREKINIYK